MPRYYLTEIKIEGFRGINNEADPLKLKFRPDVVNSVFAPNGIGKSSIFDALSYALCGHIPKLRKMQAQERPDDYYGNRFHSQQKATIDLELTPDDGTAPVTVRVERSPQGVRTVTSPSGHASPAQFLASLNEEFALLDYRTFAQFIEDSPLDRGRSFSALLGLTAYSDMRQALQSVSETRTFNSDLDVKVITAERKAADDAGTAALGSLRANYERVTGKTLTDVTKLPECAAEIAASLSGVPLLKPFFEGKKLAEIDFEAVKLAVRTAEGGEQRRELEWVTETITRLEALGVADGAAQEAEQQAVLALAEERDDLLAKTRGDFFKTLYQTAGDLFEAKEWTDENACPLCESNVAFSIRQHAAQQLDQYRGVAQKIAAISEALKNAQWVRRLSQLERTEALAVDEKDRKHPGLTGQKAGEAAKADLSAAIGVAKELEKRLADTLAALKTKQAEIEKTLPQSLVQLTEQIEYARQFHDSLISYADSQEKSKQATARLKTRERWKSFVDTVSSTFATAEGALTKAKIAAIDTEYKAMFKQIMNVGDVVPDLKRADDRQDLHVQLGDFHGQHDLSARALLSESYRNAFAISVFLAAALNHKGAPRFVVLDDVTSSFDAGHQFCLMELIRNAVQQPRKQDGLQFIILSHDGLLEKYFARLSSQADWQHTQLQGAPPMGAVLGQAQTPDRLKTSIKTFLSAGQVSQAEPLIRQYLEYKLQTVIRKVNIPVPFDFAIHDHNRMVQNCLNAINAAVGLEKRAGSLVLSPQQIQDIDTLHAPALIGNWVSHYETASGSSLSAPVLSHVIQTIDDFAECFRFDHINGGNTERRWYKSLSKKM